MSDCVEHTQKGNGYGSTHWRGHRCISLHRKVFFEHHGYLPEVVMHSCDNPRCVNPEHLIAGTRKANAQDMVSKGRNRNGARPLPAATLAAIQSDTGTQQAIAERYGVSQNTVSRIKRGVWNGSST